MSPGTETATSTASSCASTPTASTQLQRSIWWRRIITKIKLVLLTMKTAIITNSSRAISLNLTLLFLQSHKWKSSTSQIQILYKVDITLYLMQRHASSNLINCLKPSRTNFRKILYLDVYQRQ